VGERRGWEGEEGIGKGREGKGREERREGRKREDRRGEERGKRIGGEVREEKMSCTVRYGYIDMSK